MKKLSQVLGLIIVSFCCTIAFAFYSYNKSKTAAEITTKNAITSINNQIQPTKTTNESITPDSSTNNDYSSDSGKNNNVSGTTQQTSNGTPHKSNNSSETKNNTGVEKYKSPLNITLSGDYLTAFNKASGEIGSDNQKDKRLLIVKIALQILQTKRIIWDTGYHYYSLTYTNAPPADYGSRKSYYSLKKTLDFLNDGSNKTLYTDCFGFVRLTYSLAAYAINPENPGSVSGLKYLYGERGAYADCSTINKNLLLPGNMIADRLTGSGSGNRHVAIYLYTSGSTVCYADQGGIRYGKFNSNGQITYNTYIFSHTCNYLAK